MLHMVLRLMIDPTEPQSYGEIMANQTPVLASAMPVNHGQVQVVLGSGYGYSPPAQPQHTSSQTVRAQVPQGVGPGQHFQVQAGGALVTVTCPPEASAGSTVDVHIRPTTPSAAPTTANAGWGDCC